MHVVAAYSTIYRFLVTLSCLRAAYKRPDRLCLRPCRAVLTKPAEPAGQADGTPGLASALHTQRRKAAEREWMSKLSVRYASRSHRATVVSVQGKTSEMQVPRTSTVSC